MTIPIAEVIANLERVERGDITLPALSDHYRRILDQDLAELEAEHTGACAWCGAPLDPEAEPWFNQGICYLCALSRD